MISNLFSIEHNGELREGGGQRFSALADMKPAQQNQRQLNILMLADDRHEANVVQDHINSFRKHSRHNIFVVNPIWQRIDRCCVLERIDVIVIHYSILVLSDYFFPQHNAEIVRNFPGPKAQIIQDEYRWVNRMKEKMVELGIRTVFSSLNVDNLAKAYGGSPLENISFYGCLPGYISDHMKNADTRPISERPLDIVYRGRELPYWYGRQAREKSAIADHMLRLCGQYGGLIDISAKESARIYGDDWLKFVSSGRTTLGVEGGVSIFDFEEKAEKGTKEYLAEHPDADFEEVFKAVLQPLEGNIVHRTITPRIFEAICLKTALILYPGAYNGLLEANRHYIPFAPDGSLDADVVKKLRDHTYLQNMVDRTYDEIVNNDKLQASFYVQQIDHVLTANHLSENEIEATKTAPKKQKNILLLYAEAACHTGTVDLHVNSFKRYSRYNVVMLDAHVAGQVDVDVALFDAIIFHYSIVISLPHFICEDLANNIAAFDGPKMLFIQDEFRWVDRTSSAAERLGVSVIFTVVNKDVIRKIYRNDYFDNVRFEQTLTGFIPENLLDHEVPDYQDRALDIGYRARKLPAWCGSFAVQKWLIGEKTLADAQKYGLQCDIAMSEASRIYGDDWISFMSSCRATLGTESGASFVDYTGLVHQEIDKYEAANPQASFEEVRDKYLEGRDNEVVIHVISPRVFEAAALRVLMILYPGTYSGVAKPGRHYVELLPDHSNMDEVVAILRDPERAGEIIENAYKEIACSPTWTYKSFIEHFDEVLDQEMQPMEGRLASGKPIASAEWEAEQRAEYERRQVVKLAEFKRLEVSNSQGVQKLQKRMQFVLLLNKARVVSYEFIDKKMPAVISRPVLRMAQGASRKIKPLLRKLLLRA